MTRLLLRICFVVLMVSCVSSIVPADDAPVYQRDREIAFVNGGHGGHGHHGGFGGYPGFGVPYAYPWYGSQFYAGTWYERPYPYHFDYYRMRYSTPPIEQISPDCPCARVITP